MARPASHCARTPTRCSISLLPYDTVPLTPVFPVIFSLRLYSKFDYQTASLLTFYIPPPPHRTDHRSRCPTANYLCIWRPTASHGYTGRPVEFLHPFTTLLQEPTLGVPPNPNKLRHRHMPASRRILTLVILPSFSIWRQHKHTTPYFNFSSFI